jgi:hypothetical protein
MSRIFVLPALLGLVLLPGAVKAGPTVVPSDAVKAAPNQFYGPWINDRETYFHRSYYFKVQPTDKEYQRHEVIFLKKGPPLFYYYSPESKQFWGRGFYDCHGRQLYQFLQVPERSGDLNKINFDAKPVDVPPKLGAVNPPAGGTAPPQDPSVAGGAAQGGKVGPVPGTNTSSGTPGGSVTQPPPVAAKPGQAPAKGPQLVLPPDEPAQTPPFENPATRAGG